MNEQNTSLPNSELVSINLTDDNIEFLTPAKGARYSKADALIYLVRKSAKAPVTVTLYGQEYELNPGELLCTISELAKDWGWMRNTVSSFLKKMQDHKIISMTAKVKTFQVEIIAMELSDSIMTCARCLMQLKRMGRNGTKKNADDPNPEYAEAAAILNKKINAILGTDSDPDIRVYKIFSKVIGHLADMSNPHHAAAVVGLLLSNYPGGRNALAKDLASIYSCHGHIPAGQSKSKTELWLDMLAGLFKGHDDCDSYGNYAARILSYEQQNHDNKKQK